MKKIFVMSIAIAIALMAAPRWAEAHCQIPCGIFEDSMRFDMMLEHVHTIEKSMTLIDQLSKETKPDWNQIVRWVNNKEQHAGFLTEIANDYFLAQRIKPVSEDNSEAYKKYVEELILLHGIIVQSMKSKQTTSVETCAALRDLIGKFKSSYLGEDAAKHAEEAHGHKR